MDESHITSRCKTHKTSRWRTWEETHAAFHLSRKSDISQNRVWTHAPVSAFLSQRPPSFQTSCMLREPWRPRCTCTLSTFHKSLCASSYWFKSKEESLFSQEKINHRGSTASLWSSATFGLGYDPRPCAALSQTFHTVWSSTHTYP